MQEILLHNILKNIKYNKNQRINFHGIYHTSYDVDQSDPNFIYAKEIYSSIYKKFMNGEKLYFKFNEDRKDERKGAIGFLHKSSKINCFTENGFNNISNLYSIVWYEKDMVLGFDGIKNTLKIKNMIEITYLPDYNGPTIWKEKIKRPPKEKVIAKDRLGTVINIGDYVIYYVTGKLKYGTVVKITGSGNVKVKDMISSSISNITTSNRIVAANELKNKILGAKLREA